MLTICNECLSKEQPVIDGLQRVYSAFETQYGYRMHLELVHGLKEKNGKMVRLRKKMK